VRNTTLACRLERDEVQSPDKKRDVRQAASPPTLESAASSSSTGTSLEGLTLSGRFAIEQLARRGGMGSIYRAKDLAVGCPVAIKVVGISNDAEAMRFDQEGGILAGLEHPGIVRYIGTGLTPTGQPYLAMEWLDGEDLEEALSRGRWSIDNTLTLARSICEALVVAHAAGVVHRDIKPSNLFLEHGDAARVKLLDFGVARLREKARKLTGSGVLLGTVGYMAPEQAMCDEQVDARADLFSLGCVLYQCLTGRAPFESTHAVAVLAKVLHENPPPVSRRRPDVGPKLDNLVRRLLAKDREQRPRDARAVLDDLDHLAFDESAPSVPASSTSQLARSAERKIVSVILGRPGGDEGSGGITRPEDATLRSLSHRYAADVASLQGGALLLVLSGPGEASDRAAQAAQCALQMRQLDPSLVIAVGTGLADTSGGAPVGVAIDRAAALLGSRSDAAGIRVDTVTAALVSGRFDVQRRGDCEVLLGDRGALVLPRLLMGKPTPCVGRKRELALLDGVLEECVTESVARLVVVSGQPGIGKSRLAGEWLSHVQSVAPTRMLVARAEPTASGSPLFLLQQLVRRAAGTRDTDPISAQRARLEDHLRHLRPGDAIDHVTEFLAEALGVTEGDAPSQLVSAARTNPEIMREQVRRALEAWLEAEVRSSPLLMVLEDVHWGDQPSVSFLTDMLRTLAREPLMVLALARPEGETSHQALIQLSALQIRLPGLSPRAATELVNAGSPDGLSPEVVERIVRVADGNPFFLEELIRDVAAGRTELPETVLTMLQSRLGALPPDARVVLRAASVYGENCWSEGVASMVEPGVDVPVVLDVLVEKEILIRTAETRYPGNREYRFRHALLRDAAYATLTDDGRASAHRAAAEWLASVGEKDARVLADHLVAGRETARALPWLVRAARLAIDGGDIRGAIELSSRGVELGASGVQRAHLLLARGYAETWSGNADLDVLEEALRLLPYASAPWWLALSLFILELSAAGKPERASEYVTLALEAPSNTPRAGAFGQGLLTLVGSLVLLGKGDLASTIVDRVSRETDSRSPVDPVFEAFMIAARCACASVAPIRGSWELEYAFHEGRRSADRMREIGALCGESMALNYFAVAATHLGCYEEARSACLRSITLAERNDSGLNLEWARVFLAKALTRLDHAGEALDIVETLTTSRNSHVQQFIPVLTGEARLKQGMLDEAISIARSACGGSSPRLRRMAGGVLARAELTAGRPREALAAADEALAQPTSAGMESDLDLLAVRAEALLALGDEQGAEAAIERARRGVLAIAQHVSDVDLRTSFMTKVEPCARVLALAG
jgi:serine/threonine protein kinase